MTCLIRFDICYPLGILAKHMSNPGPAHVKALHQLLRYLQGTKDYGLTFIGQKKFEVRGYCDASCKGVGVQWREYKVETGKSEGGK